MKVKFGGRYFSNKITVTFLTQGLPSSFLFPSYCKSLVLARKGKLFCTYASVIELIY